MSSRPSTTTMKPGHTITKTIHHTPYPSISPQRPALSQAGKTVLITGGGAGIGHAIARAFLQASASHVIILGRRGEATAAAARELSDSSVSNPDSGAPPPRVRGLPCDISKASEVEALWEMLKHEGTAVDVLVLNAACVSAAKPILEVGAEAIYRDFGMNVRAQLDMAGWFWNQGGGASGCGTKYLVHTSSLCIHDFTVGATYPGYGLTKNAGALALQLVAQDTPSDRMQVVSFHPGALLTQAARDAGFTEESMEWDDVQLPGQFAVWAASSEAQFLHGRFVWAQWDVDELKGGEVRKRIDEDPFYLKVGVRGI